jgi:hypothetical protein
MMLKAKRPGHSKAGNPEGVHSQIRLRQGASLRPEAIAGVRVESDEKTPCSNRNCDNKLRHRLGSTRSMEQMLCGRCTRRHGLAALRREGQLREPYTPPSAQDVAYGGDEILNSNEMFDVVWDSITKGKFRGYSRNTISGRAERQAKAKTHNQSRKIQRRRTRQIYSRNKKRGNVRPKMRRQLGAGGSRAETKR